MQNFPKDGSLTRAEVSPLLMVTCEEVSQRIKSDGGSGLMVDYGEDGLTDFTLRVSVCINHSLNHPALVHLLYNSCSLLKTTLITTFW